MTKIKDAKCVKVYGPYKVKTQIVWYIYDKDNVKHIAHNIEQKQTLIENYTN